MQRQKNYGHALDNEIDKPVTNYYGRVILIFFREINCQPHFYLKTTERKSYGNLGGHSVVDSSAVSADH